MLSKEEIKYFKTHKNEITDELLETLRSQGKLSKAQALEILDLPKDSDNYYLDAYNTRISYNGSRGLKKAYTKLNLSPIHISELEKCANDPLYFLRNYVRMTTPKGFDFVDSRPYQDEFIQLLSDDSIENVISMQPRQSSKSTTTSVKLAHLYCFKKDINIGIVAYSGNSAREFLDKTKKMLIGLPIWMQPGTVTWNKGSIECENNIKILTDVPSSDAFRGTSTNIIVVDECLEFDTIINVYSETLNESFDIKIGDFYNQNPDTNNFKVLTSNGYKSFKGIKKTTRYDNLQIFFEDSNIIVTPEHKFYNNESFIRAKDIKINNIINGKKVKSIKENVACSNEFFDLLDVEDGHHFTANNVEVSNCAYLDPAGWIDFTDGVLPKLILDVNIRHKRLRFDHSFIPDPMIPRTE